MELLRLCSAQTLCLEVPSLSLGFLHLPASLRLRTTAVERIREPGSQFFGLCLPYFIRIMRHG